MDINQLLQGVSCACGRTHTCDIQHVYIENNAAARLTSLCRNYRHVLLVADENTFATTGAQVLVNLQDKQLSKVIFPGDTILVPDEAAIKAVQAATDGVDLIIGIGSGVIQDLCKYVSFESRIPYMIVATAPSMDGYASNGAAMITGGMKVTYPAGLPVAILADTQVIRNAPMEMLKAGYGDVIGKFSALNDWKLSHLINGEYFCQYIYDMTFDMLKKTLPLAKKLLCTYLYFKFAWFSKITKQLFPFKYPINCDTLTLGGILTNICIWSIQALASTISTSLYSHRRLSITPISLRSFPYIAFLLYFGMKTI